MLNLRSPSTYEREAGYKKSAINEDFIVPTNAEQQEIDFDNPNILKGSKYKLKDIGGEQGLYPPLRYFQELEKSGWGELKDKRMGHVHFFKKDKTVISVVVKEDFIEVYEMKKDAKF
ncbi:hypothetical protein [Paenibacillus sp. Soil522]|uniref:hypothetical protein n=1 Tax=Paenibacillus sp. Soil522 TaxID=1736388 RepID=UPI0006FD2281|nr:hypothetical protein [Paenibacillus sp. Soil522]KRE24901.1 hypothetical protein ASG81_28205 [Paenibacillus sp. Soil522]